MNKFEVKRICRMATVGVFAGMCLCGCPRERATSEEALHRPSAAVVLETDAELVRELADVAWGRSDKKRLMDAFLFGRVCCFCIRKKPRTPESSSRTSHWRTTQISPPFISEARRAENTS